MQPSPEGQLSLHQKTDLARAIIVLPSLSVIVFLRRRIGFRLLDSGWYVAVAIVVFLISQFTFDASRKFPHAMDWYALAILLFGAFHRAVAWFQFRKGTQPHSYSSGISIMQTRGTRPFVVRHNLINRIFDPLFAAAIGITIREAISAPFGNWLICAAVSLFCYELFIQSNTANRELDTADGLMEVSIQSKSVERFKGTANAATSRADTGIPTGLGADILPNDER